MFQRDDLSLLQCPACRSAGLELQESPEDREPLLEGSLRCGACGAVYPVRSGVPDLRPPKIADAAAWQPWRDHLDFYDERRRMREEEPRRLVNRLAFWARRSKNLFTEFARFTGIEGGRVLDVGCGPGGLRDALPPAVTYFGLDALAIAEEPEPAIARALAESLPFRDGTFAHVVVIDALDHFQDADAFFAEAARVLTPGGALHLAQTLHGTWGPRSLIRSTVHRAKELAERRGRTEPRDPVPHHMAEFGPTSLLAALEPRFALRKQERFSFRWFSPEKAFLSLTPR